MALYIPHSIFHLARLLYVRPETFGPYYVLSSAVYDWLQYIFINVFTVYLFINVGLMTEKTFFFPSIYQQKISSHLQCVQTEYRPQLAT
jgi:hypothetical protein